MPGNMELTGTGWFRSPALASASLHPVAFACEATDVEGASAGHWILFTRRWVCWDLAVDLGTLALSSYL